MLLFAGFLPTTVSQPSSSMFTAVAGLGDASDDWPLLDAGVVGEAVGPARFGVPAASTWHEDPRRRKLCWLIKTAGQAHTHTHKHTEKEEECGRRHPFLLFPQVLENTECCWCRLPYDHTMHIKLFSCVCSSSKSSYEVPAQMSNWKQCCGKQTQYQHARRLFLKH